MKHKVFGRKLGRKTQHRRAMWRNMAVSLFTHGQITTTLPKAKSVQPFVEKLISKARRGDLHSRRLVLRALGGDSLLMTGAEGDDIERNRYGEITEQMRVGAPRVVAHLFNEIAPRYADRGGGYTRIIKLAKHRIGDAADLVVLQLVGESDDRPKPGTSSRRRRKADRRQEFAARVRKGVPNDGEKPSEEDATEPEMDAQGTAATTDATLDATEGGAQSEPINVGGESGDVTEQVEEGRSEEPPASTPAPADETGTDASSDDQAAEGGKQ